MARGPFSFKTASVNAPPEFAQAAGASKVVVFKGRRDSGIVAETFKTTVLSRHKDASKRKKLTADYVRTYLRNMGILEDIVIHEMDRTQFLKERDIEWLGSGGEGAVFFLRGHVVKLVEPAYAMGALREVTHLLYLNPLKSKSDGPLGDRVRRDMPGVIWMYVLSDGGLAVGMRSFDAGQEAKGCTLDQRLRMGPPVNGEYLVRMLLELCRTLAYIHQAGIIHHDLKPANIYLPGDPTCPPVVFDLGQALWAKSAWGKEWLRHKHNATYWHNGTFQYMHAARRRAHIAALAWVKQKKFTPAQEANYQTFEPSFYGDVYSFARILRDVSASPYPCWSAKEDQELGALARRLIVGEEKHEEEKPKSGWFGSVFGKSKDSKALKSAEELYPNIDRVGYEVEKVLKNFDSGKPKPAPTAPMSNGKLQTIKKAV